MIVDVPFTSDCEMLPLGQWERPPVSPASRGAQVSSRGRIRCKGADRQRLHLGVFIGWVGDGFRGVYSAAEMKRGALFEKRVRAVVDDREHHDD